MEMGKWKALEELRYAVRNVRQRHSDKKVKEAMQWQEQRRGE